MSMFSWPQYSMSYPPLIFLIWQLGVYNCQAESLSSPFLIFVCLVSALQFSMLPPISSTRLQIPID
ncbi:hypothetical protein F5X97DRAFT_291130 [Nemania serpens]|nr:hypothetical protein F5X97DRAFT_291130 [Nemania serpens]